MAEAWQVILKILGFAVAWMVGFFSGVFYNEEENARRKK